MEGNLMDSNNTPVMDAASASQGINAEEKQLATIVYVLQAVAVFIGLTSIVGVIMNYVKRGDLQNEVVRSHFNYQIRTFWWTLVWSILSAIFTAVTFGFGAISFLVVLVWYIYRVVKGWIRLNDAKSV